MFSFFKKAKAQEFPIRKKPAEVRNSADSIAAPKFRPIDVVAPSQSIPGKFDYHSATWKYLQNHLNERLLGLRAKNDNVNLTIERTQLLRGQIKEIKALLQHTNQLAGISVSPTKTSLGINLTGRGPTYE